MCEEVISEEAEFPLLIIKILLLNLTLLPFTTPLFKIALR